jgi:hypothetical protein
MAEGRPDIPAPLRREVLVEAGHRCAIPVCRQTPVEIAHIEPWAKVQKHEFHNLIPLCPTRHARYDGGDIDRLAMKQYKANLSVVSLRYGDLERRVLEIAAQNPNMEGISLPGGQDLHLWYLMRDGLLEKAPLGARIEVMGIPARESYLITKAGRDFVARWMNAQSVE